MKTQIPSRIVLAALVVLCSVVTAQDVPANAQTEEVATNPPAQPPVLPTPPPPGDAPFAPPVVPPPPPDAPSPPIPPAPLSNLDNIVDMVQHSSPEVMIAEAQLREAEAKLRQAQLAAIQQAIQSTYDRKVLEEARKNVEQLRARVKSGSSPHQELQEAQERLAQVEAALAKQDAALKMMAGPLPGMPDLGNAPMGLARRPRFPAPRPALPEEPVTDIERALSSPVTIEFDDANLDAILEFVGDYVGVNIVLDVGLAAADQPVTIKIQDVPLKVAFLALADVCGDVCFVVRDYGVFVTTPDRATTVEAPTIPSNIPLYLPLAEAGGFGRGGLGGGGFGGGAFGGGAFGGGGLGGEFGRLGEGGLGGGRLGADGLGRGMAERPEPPKAPDKVETDTP